METVTNSSHGQKASRSTTVTCSSPILTTTESCDVTWWLAKTCVSLSLGWQGAWITHAPWQVLDAPDYKTDLDDELKGDNHQERTRGNRGGGGHGEPRRKALFGAPSVRDKFDDFVTPEVIVDLHGKTSSFQQDVVVSVTRKTQPEKPPSLFPSHVANVEIRVTSLPQCRSCFFLYTLFRAPRTNRSQLGEIRDNFVTKYVRKPTRGFATSSCEFLRTKSTVICHAAAWTDVIFLNTVR